MASSVVCSTDADDDWRKKKSKSSRHWKRESNHFHWKTEFQCKSERTRPHRKKRFPGPRGATDWSKSNCLFFFFFKSIAKESRLLPCSVTRLLAGFLSGWKEKQRSKKKKYPSPKSKKESDSETRPGWNEREGYRDWESDGSRRPTGGRHTWTSKRASKREEKKKK